MGRSGRQAVAPPGVTAAAARIGEDDLARRALQRRILIVVVVSQVLGGAGFSAGITVGALLARNVLGADSLAGLAVALLTLGSAGAALLVGRITQRNGRRRGLGIGFAAGGVGAAAVVIAAVTHDVVLLFVALFVYGAGTAANLQARYAGTDLARPEQRGRAVSVALVATTLGAVAGPNLIGPLGEFALALGIPALAGPFLLSAVAFTAASAVLFALLRPDPFLVAQELQSAAQQIVEPDAGTSISTRARPGTGVAAGATVMALAQIAMVAIMTMTPVHMSHHGHGLDGVGLVIGIHVSAMFLPSLVTGVLVDEVGRIPMAIASGVTLAIAGVVAALAPAESPGPLVVALVLLGIGWNLGLIAGTALLVDATGPTTRARTQGAADVLLALGGAGGGALSGVVMSSTSYAVLSLLGAALPLLIIPVLVRQPNDVESPSCESPRCATPRSSSRWPTGGSSWTRCSARRGRTRQGR